MQCFYHPDQPALGVCKHCQRGLCAACISEVDDSLACKDRHEGEAAGLNLLARRNLLQAQRMGSNYRRNAIFYFLSGALFTGFGLYQFRWTGLSGLFLLFIGLFLMYAAVANFLESRKY
ncbi:MAG: hypothetical protein Kow002_20960 [Anaerolineales bacterium]